MTRLQKLSGEWFRLTEKYPKLADYELMIEPRLTRSAGKCDRVRKRIRLAQWMVERLPLRESIDTLRHEAAHALAWEIDRDWSHGPVWKRWARELGASPIATKIVENANEVVPAFARRRWIATCPKCKVETGRRARKPNLRQCRWRCNTCGAVTVWHDARRTHTEGA